ncbi:hypothetical protein C8F04DRAFT_331985 [Mycena alexandri]|uniref:Uncharacterized protein n=1 Tax=Mycena alexandri TaxID=1745969 RepID=A0AAD6X4Q4_9AGAR|nr:hypothetical protein C8F04DRAFT_331985 [Mycena alexandri]
MGLVRVYLDTMFCGTILRNALSSLSCKIQLLPAERKVLAHCICALSVSISIDPLILDPDPSSIPPFHAASGSRRFWRTTGFTASCAVPGTQATRLASEVGILLELPENNAVSCFIIQLLEDVVGGRVRTVAIQRFADRRSRCWVSRYYCSFWTTQYRRPILYRTRPPAAAPRSPFRHRNWTAALLNWVTSIQRMVRENGQTASPVHNNATLFVPRHKACPTTVRGPQEISRADNPSTKLL